MRVAARILANGEDVGGAFAVGPRTAVTAAHVTRSRETATLSYSVTGARPISIGEVTVIPNLDVAILRLLDDTVDTLAVSEAVDGGRWTVASRYLGNDPVLTGSVDAPALDDTGR
jgi:hypothetical protein